LEGGGCQENLNDHESLKNEKQVQKLSLQDGALKFQSIEHYENFFEDPESVSIPEFENLQKTFRDQEQISESNLKISQTAIDTNPFFVLKS
jgi:alpha-D-ribose 1-methylphosphonate 5-triphosphate diphosphatase PhnM